MSFLDLSSTFEGVDTVLNGLLSKYVGLKFIGFDANNDNRPYYLGDVITTGFYYKSRKTPVTGEVVEQLRIVPASDEINQHIATAQMLELIKENGEFKRFSFKTLKEPQPPTMEWKFLINPNKQEKTVIS